MRALIAPYFPSCQSGYRPPSRPSERRSRPAHKDEQKAGHGHVIALTQELQVVTCTRLFMLTCASVSVDMVRYTGDLGVAASACTLVDSCVKELLDTCDKL